MSIELVLPGALGSYVTFLRVAFTSYPAPNRRLRNTSPRMRHWPGLKLMRFRCDRVTTLQRTYKQTNSIERFTMEAYG